MRRPRLRLRTLMTLVALVGLALGTARRTPMPGGWTLQWGPLAVSWCRGPS